MRKGNDHRHNKLPPGFLDRYRHSDGEEYRYIALRRGFLRLEYDTDAHPPLLSRVGFVAQRSPFSRPVGRLLEMRLDPCGAGDTVSYIAEEGVSGLQWAAGRVAWGHTLEQEMPLGNGQGERIELAAWVDRCVAEMASPPREAPGKPKKHYDPASDVRAVRDGDEEARDRFWKNCAPRSKEEVSLVLDLLGRAVEEDDGDLLFACCDPLKRSTAGIARILDHVTGMLEEEKVAKDCDRSELQEILAAHSSSADRAVVDRWIRLGRKSLAERGPEALYPINEGILFRALCDLAHRHNGVRELFRDAVGQAAKAPPQMREELWGCHSFRTIQKLLQGT